MSFVQFPCRPAPSMADWFLCKFRSSRQTNRANHRIFGRAFSQRLEGGSASHCMTVNAKRLDVRCHHANSSTLPRREGWSSARLIRSSGQQRRGGKRFWWTAGRCRCLSSTRFSPRGWPHSTIICATFCQIKDVVSRLGPAGAHGME